MITGGVHGDEEAGAAAANQIRTWPITRGTLVVVPFAAPQALAAGTRQIPDEGDLNRNFPGIGDPITATTGSTAAALWAFTRAVSPQWLIDLHEGIGFSAVDPGTVGSSIIHMNESVTNVQVSRMLAAINATITDPSKKFSDLGSSGPIDGSLARASVEHLDSRGMIVETTSTGQELALRVSQHRLIVNQFLMDQTMISGAYGGPRNGVIDEFTFDEPAGTRLTSAGNSYPNGGVWNTSPFDTQVSDGMLRIQRATTGTSTTSTGTLGAGEVRVRAPGAAGNLPTDLGEGFATMVVDGWDFRGAQSGETISFGFRNVVSPAAEDTAHIVLRRTGANEVSLSGTGFGTGSGSIASQVRFPALQDTPVQFVLQLNKQTNLDGSPVVSGSTTGGFYRIFSQTLGQDYVELGSGAAVRQDRNGNNLVMRISGSVGASGGFFDVDRLAFESALPRLLVPESAPGSVNLLCTSGTLTQSRVGFPVISGTLRVEKNGAGTMVLDGANTYTGVTSILQGVVALTSTAAISRSPLIDLAAGSVLDTRSLANGLAVSSGQTIAGSGTVLGSVTFGRGATLSPGATAAAQGLALGASAPFADGQFAALQAFAVPEPGALSLGGAALGILGVVAVRRQRMRSRRRAGRTAETRPPRDAGT
jgi:autotransporter-associated beta strand protein